MSRLPEATRRRVRERARSLCEYCLTFSELTGHEFTIDHIIAEALGGTHDLSNLCWCCFWCNNYKQARVQAYDPRTSRFVPLFHPRQDDWHTHFRWTHGDTRILGRTATGRATVTALRLNRPNLIVARRLWVRYGLHPPDFS
jgi:HNH endonuclease